jgi:hypothetical protein
MEIVVVVVVVAVLVALVAAIAVVARRRRRRTRVAPPVAVAPAVAPAVDEATDEGTDDRVPVTAAGARSLWPSPDRATRVDVVAPEEVPVEPPEEFLEELPEEDHEELPVEDHPGRSEGWRGRVPFAEPLSARLTPDAPTTPAELVARFDAVAAPVAADEVVASLAALGYEVRWRRAAELALGSGDGHVARILVEARPEGGATVGVELEPDEVADVAVGLLDRLRAAGYRIDRREATTVVLRDDAGAAVRVTRVPSVRA